MMTGGCLCGAVRYEIGGRPVWAVLCHCRDCQKASGSGHVPVMGVLHRETKISGKTSAYAVTAETGRTATRHFCPSCGSLLFGEPDRETGVMSLYAGTLDDPSAFAPQFAIFHRSRVAWDHTSDGLPKFEAMPTG